MIWKVLYDFRRPNWIAYGHVLFIEAETEADALVAGYQAAQQAEPDGTLVRVDVLPATEAQRARHDRLREAQALWKHNAGKGIANDPKAL